MSVRVFCVPSCSAELQMPTVTPISPPITLGRRASRVCEGTANESKWKRGERELERIRQRNRKQKKIPTHYFGPYLVRTEQLYRSMHTSLCLCSVNSFYSSPVCLSLPSVVSCTVQYVCVCVWLSQSCPCKHSGSHTREL